MSIYLLSEQNYVNNEIEICGNIIKTSSEIAFIFNIKVCSQ